MVEELGRLGVAVRWMPARVSTYPPAKRWLRPLWAPAAVATRFVPALASWRGDITWIVRELVSTLVTFEPLTKRPRVFDVDDAVWLSRGGDFARRLARRCDMVIAGNDYLADWFSRHNERVVVVPTAVDTERFAPLSPSGEPSDRQIIGWSGTSGNLRFLHQIEPALRHVLGEHPRAIMRVVCDQPPRFSDIPPERIEFIRWTRDSEAEAIRGMDVGLSPLEDSEWTRGKCGYKLLLYLSCGVPAVASPVGVNASILGQGEVGHAARTLDDWVTAIEGLLRDRDRAARMARSGRHLVEENFSVKVIAPRLASCFHSLQDQRRKQV